MKQLYKVITCLFLLCFTLSGLKAQLSQDSVSIDTISIQEKKGSIFSGKPGKAMIMSLVIPGTGQIYNKSYLRVPFVWGAVGGMGYLVYYNTIRYNCFNDAYIASIDHTLYEIPEHCAKDFENVDLNQSAQLKALRDEYNNNRQLSIVGLSLVWVMNGIDAFVNAHLKEFDVNENLSIDIGSRLDNDPNSPMRMGIFVQF
jgi:hypothetical protein